MKIGIVGTGAMACLFAHRFASAQHAVTVIGSWQSQIDAINAHGISLLEPNGIAISQPVSAEFLTSNSSKDYDIIFVITKANRTANAALWLQQFTTAVVISIQNGLGNAEILKELNPNLCIITAASTQGARVVREGVIENTGNGITHFANTGCCTQNSEIIQQLFTRSQLNFRLQNNADSVLWGKLLINAGINALTAILDVNNGFLVENETANKMMQLLGIEVSLVAEKLGIKLPFDDAFSQLIKICSATAENTSSMRADILRGAKTEIDFINGAVLKKADEMHLPAPANQYIVALISQIENQELKPGLHNLALLEKFLQNRSNS